MRRTVELRSWLAAGIMVCAGAGVAVAAPVKVVPNHPILGSWEWTRSDTGCKESFTYRADGTARITSGEEITDNTYLIDRTPDDTRFYELQIKTVKDNGGRDCNNDEKDNTGETNKLFIFINGERSMHVVCSAAAFDRCFGPLTRTSK